MENLEKILIFLGELIYSFGNVAVARHVVFVVTQLVYRTISTADYGRSEGPRAQAPSAKPGPPCRATSPCDEMTPTPPRDATSAAGLEGYNGNPSPYKNDRARGFSSTDENGTDIFRPNSFSEV